MEKAKKKSVSDLEKNAEEIRRLMPLEERIKAVSSFRTDCPGKPDTFYWLLELMFIGDDAPLSFNLSEVLA